MMNAAAIIKELRTLEADAKVHAEGLRSVARSCYLLRRELEGIDPSAPVAGTQSQAEQEAAAKASLSFKKKLARKLAKNK